MIISEASVPESLQSFVLEIEPQDIHHLMAFASLFIGESTTMPAEAAVLGTPSIVIEEKGRGYIRLLEKQSNMLKWFKPGEENKAIESAHKFLENSKEFSEKQNPNIMVHLEHTDIGSFLEWLFEDLESGFKKLKNQQTIPYQFVSQRKKQWRS